MTIKDITDRLTAAINYRGVKLTEDEYMVAIKWIEDNFQSFDGGLEAELLDMLIDAVEQYEDENLDFYAMTFQDTKGTK